MKDNRTYIFFAISSSKWKISNLIINKNYLLMCLTAYSFICSFQFKVPLPLHLGSRERK